MYPIVADVQDVQNARNDAEQPEQPGEQRLRATAKLTPIPRITHNGDLLRVYHSVFSERGISRFSRRTRGLPTTTDGNPREKRRAATYTTIRLRESVNTARDCATG